MDTELSSVLGSQLGQFDLSALDADISFTNLVWQAVNGELDLSLSGVLETGARIFMNELWLNNGLIRQLLVIALISALLKCLSDSFSQKAASELGFYVTYIMMVMLLLAGFRLSTSLLTDLVSTLSDMMEACVPLMISLMAMSGHVAGAAVFPPMLFFAIHFTTRFITLVFIPLTLAAVVLQIVNHLDDGERLGKIAALIKKCADWAMKAIMLLFALLLTLQKISVPILNNVALKTARAAANAVPVVGGALGSAMDTVLYWSGAAKSGVLVALVIVICVAVSVPLLKMLAIIWVYKMTAAMIQPVCDERIVNCIDEIGGYTGTLLSAGVMAGVMFLYAVIILLSF